MNQCQNCKTALSPDALTCSQCGRVVAPGEDQKIEESETERLLSLQPQQTPVLETQNHPTTPLNTSPDKGNRVIRVGAPPRTHKVTGSRARTIGCTAMILALVAMLLGIISAIAATGSPQQSSSIVATHVPTPRPTLPATPTPTVGSPLPFNVTGIDVTVSPNGYTGVCSNGTTSNFTATITVPANTIGGTVKYHWLRSNTTITPNQTITFAPGDTSQNVIDTWTLGNNIGSGNYWEALQVISPTTLTSAHTIFTVNCQLAFTVKTIIVAATPNQYTGDCNNSAMLTFSGTIIVPADTLGGTVTYDWLRSDGASTVSQTISFAPKVTSQQVTDTWTIDAANLSNGTYWEVLQVLAPNTLNSARANLTVTCQLASNGVALSAASKPSSDEATLPAPWGATKQATQ